CGGLGAGAAEPRVAGLPRPSPCARSRLDGARGWVGCDRHGAAPGAPVGPLQPEPHPNPPPREVGLPVVPRTLPGTTNVLVVSAHQCARQRPAQTPPGPTPTAPQSAP